MPDPESTISIIAGGKTYDGRIIVGGVDISHYVIEASLSLRWGQPPELLLVLAPEALSVEGTAKIHARVAELGLTDG